MLIRVLVDTTLEALLVRPVTGICASRIGFRIGGVRSESTTAVDDAGDCAVGNRTLRSRLCSSESSLSSIEDIFSGLKGAVCLVALQLMRQIPKTKEHIPCTQIAPRDPSLTSPQRQKRKENSKIKIIMNFFFE